MKNSPKFFNVCEPYEERKPKYYKVSDRSKFWLRSSESPRIGQMKTLEYSTDTRRKMQVMSLREVMVLVAPNRDALAIRNNNWIM